MGSMENLNEVTPNLQSLSAHGSMISRLAAIFRVRMHPVLSVGQAVAEIISITMYLKT